MFVWEVLGKRTEDDELVVVGGVKAPDVDMALLLAKETHFRHKEGVEYAVRRRGSDEVHAGPYRGDVLGGLTDHSYRRQQAYVGVGAKLKKVAAELADRGLRIDAPRPPAGRAARPHSPAEATAVTPEDAREQLSPDDLAAHGTAG